jgi:acid phosphatase (class A)
MRKALLLHFLIALQVFASPAFSQDFVFLSNDEVDLTKLLAPAPDPKSEEQQRDLAAVLVAQQTRTPPQIERAVADNALSVFRFDDVLGPAFTAERLPVTSTFFERAQSDSRLGFRDLRPGLGRDRLQGGHDARHPQEAWPVDHAPDRR